MNNQNNNEMNMSNSNLTNNINSGVNSTPINNQPTQGMNQNVSANAAGDNTNYTATQVPQYSTAQQNVGMNNQNYGTNQNINNGMNPNYYNQPTPNYSTSNFNNNKKALDTKTTGLIIGIVVLALICIILAIMLFAKDNKLDDSENKNINEYEENENNNDTGLTDIENEEEVATNTVEYAGFEFTKIPGYSYSVESDGLYIENSYYSMVIDVLQANFTEVKTENFITEMKSTFGDKGMTVGAIGIENIAGEEVFVADVTYSGMNALYYVIDANDNHVYIGMVLNYLNTFDHTGNMEQVFSIIKDAKYRGGYFGHTISFNKTLDITKLK